MPERNRNANVGEPAPGAKGHKIGVTRTSPKAYPLNPGSAPRLHVRTRSGRWLALCGSLTEPKPLRPSETVIVIEPAKPEEVAGFNTAAYGLTAREEEIARLVARGDPTRQISRSLRISEHTVQNHLRDVFEKVGGRSRGELLKRLFFEADLPAQVPAPPLAAERGGAG